MFISESLKRESYFFEIIILLPSVLTAILVETSGNSPVTIKFKINLIFQLVREVHNLVPPRSNR
eukprot:SAG22_NODE_2310_length_2732_cov_60.443980_3_plen_64_part_00